MGRMRGARRVSAELSQEFLREAALRYLDRYDASVARLRAVLLRRAKAAGKGEGPAADEDQVGAWIDEILEAFQRSGLISDDRYSEQMVASLRRRGLGARAISARLRQRGVGQETAAAALRDEPGAGRQVELAAAQRLVQRKRLGPRRPEEEREKYRRRDLAALARAGFDWETAQRALEPEAESGS